MVRTYEKLRIGIVIVTLLFVCTLLFVRYTPEIEKPGVVRHSISAYFHFPKDDKGQFTQESEGWRMRDVFVAALGIVGILLIVYQGYTLRENVALTVAGAALIGVAVFPMDWPVRPDAVRSATEWMHYTCAVTFFVGLAYVCLTQARATLEDSAAGNPARKKRFEITYYALGGAMIALPALSFSLYFVSTQKWAPAWAQNYVFWAELSGVFVFMVYWIVKTVELRLPDGVAAKAAAAIPVETVPPANRAQWVAAYCAIVTAIAAIFGVYSFYAATQREKLKAAQEAIARIYPMDSEVKGVLGRNNALRPLSRNDPDGSRWNAEKDKGNTRHDFSILSSYYGNLFEYYLLIRDNLLDHPQGKGLVKGWDDYMKDVCQNSYAFRGYIMANRDVWSKQFIDKFDEYTIDAQKQRLPFAPDVQLAATPAPAGPK
jgi:hypothetical protein